MGNAAAFDQIAARFANAKNLPEMPTAAMKVNQLLEADDASPLDVERAIVNDPALTAALLRTASSALYGRADQPVTTVRTALMRLGSKAVKAVTLSLWTQALVSATQGRTSMDANRFTDHSTFVGYLARYLFSCRMHRDPFSTTWSPDEVFAAGVLHDLGTALLAVVEPSAFERVLSQARARNTPFSVKFFQTFEHPLSSLGARAVETWGLDPLFSEVIGYLDTPQDHPKESIAISCVHLADRIATANKHALFDLPAESTSEFALAEVGLPTEDMPTVLALIAASIAETDPKNKRRVA
jgi:HD-like signal output (HDOD) protein